MTMATTDDFIATQLEAIDEQIDKINNHKVVRAAEKLLEKRTRLMNARRALLGAGPRTTGGSGGGRVTQDEVVAWFRANGEPGDTFEVQQIADAMGHSMEVVRGHLNRGKGERFIKAGNKWALRDPKNGINDEEDVEE